MSWPASATRTRSRPESAASERRALRCRRRGHSQGTRERPVTRRPWRLPSAPSPRVEAPAGNSSLANPRVPAPAGNRRLAQFSQGFVEQCPRGFELTSDCRILDPVEQGDHFLPARRIALLKTCLDLPDRLGREEQTAARVVQDLPRDFQLAARPADYRVASLRIHLLGVKDFHAESILDQAR